MHILLAAATTFEIQPATDFLLQSRTHPLSTTWSFMRQIDRDRPDLIIQAGIAGCLSRKPYGEVFTIRDETLADLGVWEDQQFKTPFDLRLADPNEPPFTAGRLINPYQTLLTLTGLEPVSAITVNEISTNPDRIDWYRENTSAVIESMEGGALHYIGLQERIPFLQLRSISNDVGIRDKSKWNIPLAIQRLNDRLIRLLQVLEQKDNTILNAFNPAL
jgi:futalosine hydrolase